MASYYGYQGSVSVVDATGCGSGPPVIKVYGWSFSGPDATSAAGINQLPAEIVIDYSPDEVPIKEKTVEKGRKYAARKAILLGNLTATVAAIEQEQRRRRRDQHPGQVPRSLAWGMRKAHARRRPQQGKREE